MSCFSVNLDVSSILLRLWDPIGRRIGHIVKLKENMDSLDEALADLKAVRDDLQGRVQTAEEQRQLERTHQVERWLQSVEGVETKVAEMEGTFERMKCFGWNFRPNLYSRYNLGKRVMKVRAEVNRLIEKRREISFDDVAVQPPPPAVQHMPCPPAIGMDPLLQKILRWLREDDNVGVIGIYGMGGVGKTTLLKKINQKFLEKLEDFGVVIWVVVSKEASIGKIQKEIGKKLGLSFAENASDEGRADVIVRALRRKRFILLLDDIWERVDLEEKVGIPRLTSQNKSKVVFTTRGEDVCGQMGPDKEVKVEILGSQEAWDLFRKNAGEKAIYSDPEIPALARSVAEECRGLPLALITIGRAMARKKTREEWKHAITALKKNKAASEIARMEDEVFFRLKFSYDTLDDTLKSCFLYCSLFPEDYHICKEWLIDHWIGEGIIIINEWDDYEEACNKGHDIIGQLKAACLLESGDNEEIHVKMHDVMRDLALWIASDKFFVLADAELRRVTEAKRWKEAERVSLMQNNIEEITVTPICPKLLTLFLQWNPSLSNVNNSFFQHMPLLRVLDLSNTQIRELPLEIFGLFKLRYLNLEGTDIRELPSGICGLIELRYLNLSFTQLIELPKEMENLVNLNNLELICLGHPLHIPPGVISGLLMLKVFKLHRVDIKSSAFDLMELEKLQYLTHLEIDISGDSDFQIFLQSNKLPKVTRELTIKDLTAETTSVQLSSIFGEVMGNLRDLSIRYCKNLKELMIGADRRAEGNYSISKMESLTLDGLSDLSIIRLGWSSLQNLRRSSLQYLRKLDIQDCHKLKNLTWILQLHNIQEIDVVQCVSFEEVIGNSDVEVRAEVIGSSDVEVGAEGLGRLRKLCLLALPALTSISNQARSFPSLTVLQVGRCRELKKLNIHCNTDPRLKIFGKQKWWDDLEWEEESIRSHFLPLFEAK